MTAIGSNPDKLKEFLVSIIIHRCSCGHPDIYHQHPRVVDNGGYCSYGSCSARQHELGAPELLPTFVDGVLNEYVYAPGSKGSGFSLCDCGDCVTLYGQVKNEATPLRPWHYRQPA